MSRVIRFRAWMKEERQMVMVAQIDFTFDLVTGYRVWKSTGPDEETRMYEESSKCELMQFTGLHDKNGKEIWEGDVVGQRIGKTTRECLVVEWNEKYGQWVVDETRPLHEWLWWWGIHFKCGEVLGNIYENPELLGEKS